MALRFQPKAVKDAKGLPRQDWDRLKERLERIAREPSADHPDVKPYQDGFRVRHGNWRAIYKVNDAGDVVVIKVGHRREVYRRQ